MRLGVLFSGGKDSCLALHYAIEYGHKIACLICIKSENKDSFMFHTPAVDFVDKQANALGIPLLSIKSRGKEERELDDLRRAIKTAIDRYKIQGIVSGAVRSIYQASRIQRICNLLQLECFNPFWMRNEEGHLLDLIKRRFVCIVTRVSAYGFDGKWVGREIDSGFLYDIKKLNEKHGVSLAGEGGEYESFVLDAPLFRKRLAIEKKMVRIGKHYACMDIKKVVLEKKGREE